VPSQPSSVTVGLVVTPTLDEPALNQLVRELRERLAELYPDVDWHVVAVHDALVAGPVGLTELVDAVRARMLEEGWDLTVAVTDLPLRLARRPLLTHSSPSHNVALVSLPAIGVVRRQRRLLDLTADALAVLIGDVPSDRDAQDRPRFGVRARLVELGTGINNPSETQVAVFLARVITGNIRLLLGMIVANRPWRLIPRLSRAMIGAVAAGVFALVTNDVWQIAASLDAWRLAALTLISISAAAGALIVTHGLWERAPDPRVREQVALFNLVTTITVLIGIGSLYLGLFVLSLGVAALAIDESLLSHAIGRSAGVDEYLRLAWLTASLATGGGALGGVVESDAAVREAAYAHHPDS
jgi:hypothetical protein